MTGADEHTINLIVAATCRESGMIANVLLSERRHAQIVHWRNAVCYVAHDVIGMSLPVIGEAIKRDHTTVLHGVRAARVRMASDKDFARALKRIAKASTPLSSDDKMADALVAFRALDEASRQRFLAFVAAGGVK